MKILLPLALFIAVTSAARERDMGRINWMELRELVPSKITGTLEPHGVANSGADITAPEAMARTMAPLNLCDDDTYGDEGVSEVQRLTVSEWLVANPPMRL